jgi:hypothetical protein
LFKVPRYSFKGNWKEFFIALAHPQVKVLYLTKEAICLAGYNSPNHASLMVVINHPIITLGRKYWATGRLVLLSVGFDLALR